MPRDGSGIFTLPYPAVVDGTTIESAIHNGTMSDIALQLNGPVPIIAGGTGANNAYDAMIALKGEVTKQNVTNYDSHVFVAGSFYSAPGATAAPASTTYIAGICYVGPDPTGMVIEARDIPTGVLFVRVKMGGVWGGWLEQPGSVADNDARYVNLSGDTMTGALSIADVTASTSPTTGALTIAGGVGVGGAIHAENNNMYGRDFYASRTTTTGYVFLGSDTIHHVGFDGTNFLFGGVGNVYNNGRFISPASNGGFTSTNNGAFTPANPDGASLFVGGGYGGGITLGDGANRTSIWAQGADLYMGVNGAPATISSAGNLTVTGGGNFGNVLQAAGFRTRQGLGGPNGGNYFNISYSPASLFMDASNIGNFAFTSDYRTKKDVADLPSTWDTVKALRPIKYTQAQFSPPSHVEYVKEQAARAAQVREGEEPPIVPGHLFEADDIERWGFVAHELQATLTPSASSGVKDSPDTIQSPNPFTVIAALTKALQEAMTRIEALEAR